MVMLDIESQLQFGGTHDDETANYNGLLYTIYYAELTVLWTDSVNC